MEGGTNPLRAEKTEAQKSAAIELGLSAVLITPSAARQPSGRECIEGCIALKRYNPL